MRPRSIVKSLDLGQNRFELCHQAFKAIRKLHRPGNRIQDTARDALQRLAGAKDQSQSVDLKDGNGSVLEVTQEVATKTPAVATPSEPIAGVPPADLSTRANSALDD